MSLRTITYFSVIQFFQNVIQRFVKLTDCPVEQRISDGSCFCAYNIYTGVKQTNAFKTAHTIHNMTAYAEQYRPCYVNVSLYVTKICTAHSQQLACIVTSLTYLHQSWNEDVKASLILCAAYINSSCSPSSFFIASISCP